MSALARLGLLIGVCMTTGAFALYAIDVPTALACRTVMIEPSWERLRFSIEASDLIFVGIVTHEGTVPDSSRTYQEDYEIYNSLVQPIATLKGETPPTPIRLGNLNDLNNNQCLGASRLPEGGPYLLFLGWSHAGYLNNEPIGWDWNLLPFGGKIVFNGNTASFDELWSWYNTDIGPTEQVIRIIARMSGSSEREIQSALAAAQRQSLVHDDQWDLPVFTCLIAFVIGGFLLGARPRLTRL